MIRVFAGYEAREAIGWSVFQESLMQYASQPVSVTALSGLQRDGSNAFAFERFRIPEICNFGGWAIYCDGSDMMLRSDIAELYELRDETKAVQVVHHTYKTGHPRKYIGTRMASDNIDYPRKNWSSVILWNCAHPSNILLRQGLIDSVEGSYLHRFGWLNDDEIGVLPQEWNHLVREFAPNANAKLAHYTLGIPGFLCYYDDEFATDWRGYAHRAQLGLQYDINKYLIAEAA